MQPYVHHRSKALFVSFSLSLVLFSSIAAAQSSQYKRKQTTPKATATKAASSKAGTPNTAAEKPASNQKLNIEDLEKRYWAPKDTEFKVVQNRKFSKEGRFNLSLGTGILFNDTFSTGTNLFLSSTHYFNEHHGVELRFEMPNQTQNEGTRQVQSVGGEPDQNFEDWALAVNYNWIPFYGKISVLDEKIIYFDMAIYAGLGAVQYTQQGVANTRSLNSFSFNFGVSQQYFLSKNWALKLDVSTRLYNEQRIEFQSSADLGTFKQLNTYILFGGTYFFGSGDKTPSLGGMK